MIDILPFKTAVQRFYLMEERLGLFCQQINGIFFWPYIRFGVFDFILSRSVYFALPHPGASRDNSRLRFGLTMLKGSILKNPFLVDKTDILFLGHERRKIGSDKLYWDVYCDHIIHSLDEKYALLEEPFSNNHLHPAKTKNIRYLDFFRLFSYAGLWKRYYKNRLTSKENNIISSLSHEIKTLFNLEIDITKIILIMLAKRMLNHIIWGAFLRKVRPKALFVVCSYSKCIEISVCRKHGIPVIELQHGIIDKFHPAYSFPNNIDPIECFPDYILTFGQYWNSKGNYPIPYENRITLGYPYLEEHRKLYKNIKKSKQILILSQGPSGNELSKFAVKLRKIISDEYKIIYKLHPGESRVWRNLYPWLVDSKIDIVDQETPSLYELMAHSKIQIGVSSTALYEGLAFGCQTYVVDLPGYEYMDDLIQTGVVKKISYPEELLESNREFTNFDIEHFFESNWQKNFKQFLYEKRLLAVSQG